MLKMKTKIFFSKILKTTQVSLLKFCMVEEYESNKVNNLKRTKILLNLLLWRWSHYSLFNTTNSEFFEEKKW